MEESEDNLSADDINHIKSPKAKGKPKKRSLVERELETNLTARVTSPIEIGDGSSTSRYGRARRLKNEVDKSDLEKAVAKSYKSPKLEKSPKATMQSPVYKMHASNSPIKLDLSKSEPNFDNQIENIYTENISLSRFGSAEKKISPAKRFPKVYIRKDLIQTKDKDKETEETVVLIKNMFSPVKSTHKSHSNSLEKSSEKYGNKRRLSNTRDTSSVVKTLDFDEKKSKKDTDRKVSLSKNEVFELEAKSDYQVGDLAWARMGTYPFWPCIITREPVSGLFVKKKLFGRNERNILNVTFFGDNGRRSWIVDSMLRPFLGQLEFEAIRSQFTSEAKKKDPKLYMAYFISEKKLPQWIVSVEEAEMLLREPKRLRLDILSSMLMKVKCEKTPKSEKSKKVSRTDSDVSLSESLYDTLFSEDDSKGIDADRSRNKSKNKSLDVSEVVTACLDNMAAKTGITKIQRQSHMDRWLLKAKTKTPEKSHLKSQTVQNTASNSAKVNKLPKLNITEKPYKFRSRCNESQNSDKLQSSEQDDDKTSDDNSFLLQDSNKEIMASEDCNKSTQKSESSASKDINSSNKLIDSKYEADLLSPNNYNKIDSKNESSSDNEKNQAFNINIECSDVIKNKNVLNKLKQSIEFEDDSIPSSSSADISGVSTSLEISRVDAQASDIQMTEKTDIPHSFLEITNDSIDQSCQIDKDISTDKFYYIQPITSSPKGTESIGKNLMTNKEIINVDKAEVTEKKFEQTENTTTTESLKDEHNIKNKACTENTDKNTLNLNIPFNENKSCMSLKKNNDDCNEKRESVRCDRENGKSLKKDSKSLSNKFNLSLVKNSDVEKNKLNHAGCNKNCNNDAKLVKDNEKSEINQIKSENLDLNSLSQESDIKNKICNGFLKKVPKDSSNFFNVKNIKITPTIDKSVHRDLYVPVERIEVHKAEESCTMDETNKKTIKLKESKTRSRKIYTCDINRPENLEKSNINEIHKESNINSKDKEHKPIDKSLTINITSSKDQSDRDLTKKEMINNKQKEDTIKTKSILLNHDNDHRGEKQCPNETKIDNNNHVNNMVKSKIDTEIQSVNLEIGVMLESDICTETPSLLNFKQNQDNYKGILISSELKQSAEDVELTSSEGKMEGNSTNPKSLSLQYKQKNAETHTRLTKEDSDLSKNREKHTLKKDDIVKVAYTDPDFLKYLEIKQDAILDEHPELSQEEITSYLYKTWLYEESKKPDKKKSDEVNQTSLVRGTNYKALDKDRGRIKLRRKRPSGINPCKPFLPPKTNILTIANGYHKENDLGKLIKVTKENTIVVNDPELNIDSTPNHCIKNKTPAYASNLEFGKLVNNPIEDKMKISSTENKVMNFSENGIITTQTQEVNVKSLYQIHRNELLKSHELSDLTQTDLNSTKTFNFFGKDTVTTSRNSTETNSLEDDKKNQNNSGFETVSLKGYNNLTKHIENHVVTSYDSRSDVTLDDSEPINKRETPSVTSNESESLKKRATTIQTSDDCEYTNKRETAIPTLNDSGCIDKDETVTDALAESDSINKGKIETITVDDSEETNKRKITTDNLGYDGSINKKEIAPVPSGESETIDKRETTTLALSSSNSINKREIATVTLEDSESINKMETVTVTSVASEPINKIKIGTITSHDSDFINKEETVTITSDNNGSINKREITTAPSYENESINKGETVTLALSGSKIKKRESAIVTSDDSESTDKTEIGTNTSEESEPMIKMKIGTITLHDSDSINKEETITISLDKNESLNKREITTGPSDDNESINKRRYNSKKSQDEKNDYEDPEFQKYLEFKQDAVKDEHPELSQEEVISYLYKTWLYEESNKSDKKKSDEVDQTSLVKGANSLNLDKTKGKRRLSRKKPDDLKDTKPKGTPTTINKFLTHNGYHDGGVLNKLLNNEIELETFTSDANIVNCAPSESTQIILNVNASDDNLREKKYDIDVDSKSFEMTDTSSITNRKEARTQTREKNSTEEPSEDDDNLDSASITSADSEMSLSRRRQRWKEKQAQEDKKKALGDSEFVRYLELRQDSVMDEHPELSEAEITNYLYKIWLYEENLKIDGKRADEIDQTTLVKGVDQEPGIKKIRKKFKVLKEDSQESFKISEVFEVSPKEKSKRSIIRPYYNEEFSDAEDEMGLFEIFRTKKRLSKPNVEDVVDTAMQIENIGSAPETVQISNAEETVMDEIDLVEMYFEQLTTPKPNVFKGLIRERVCEICEKVGNLVKCKTCHGMFHVDCVKNQTKPSEERTPGKGRKKKRKYRRKPKNSEETFLDSEGHSDERTHDASSDPNLSTEFEREPIVANADDFEALAAAKMKEILGDLDKIEYDYESTKVAISWNVTEPGKCQIVDVKLQTKRKEELIDTSSFKCNDCEKFETPICFVCKSPVSPKHKVEYRQKCQVAHCYKHYHLECLDHWPQTQFNGGESKYKKNKECFEAMSCPRHVCHTCVSDDPRGCKTRFSGDKLARCVRCPATYHSFTKCLPAGSQILTGSQIICPRHYQHRPGKVPCHVNTGWCFICALGGTLICCEYCPTSFHAECLNIDPPEGGYMCEDCETGRLPLYGEMVWVKLGHYRWWPGIILHPSQIPHNILAVKHSQGEFVVRFFGQYDHYWVNRGRVFPFQEGDTGKISSQKSKIDAAFTMAVEHASRACEILKNAAQNDEESQDIASSLLPPHYVKLKVNRPVGALSGRRPDAEESSLTQCECDPRDLEPCGPYSQCLNRMLLTECGPTCRAGDRCNNRAFEKRLYPKMEPYRTPHRGWGLKCLEDIRPGQFVIEYVGELLDEGEFRRRMRRKHEVRDENFYFLTLDKERMIDAGPKGNLARFMNHSCEPNCETQKWTVLGDVRVGLFALRHVPANSELTFNYNLESAGIEKKQCMCGAKRCSGYIGAKPKQDDPQPKKSKAIKKTYKKRKNAEESPAARKPKQRIGRPAKAKELTDIEKDLLIITSATRAADSDHERLSDAIDARDSNDANDANDAKGLKRKRKGSESLTLCFKRVKTGDGDEFRID